MSDFLEISLSGATLVAIKRAALTLTKLLVNKAARKD